jgi:hypothetical protein
VAKDSISDLTHTYREILVEEESILRAPQILLRTVEVNPKKNFVIEIKKIITLFFVHKKEL